MNESFLINQVKSCMLPYTPQITKEASFFRLPYLDHAFMIGNVPGTYPWWSAMLVKLQAFPNSANSTPDVIIIQHLWTATFDVFMYNVTQGKPLISCMIKYMLLCTKIH